MGKPEVLNASAAMKGGCFVSKVNLTKTCDCMDWHVFPVWSVYDNGNCRCGKHNDKRLAREPGSK